MKTTMTGKVLVSALYLEQRRKSPFPQEELVLMAWNKFPAEFGLRGHESMHPDASRVLCYLMGSRGLVALGLLGKPSERHYTLTPEGWREAYEAASLLCPSVPRPHVPDEHLLPPVRVDAFLTRTLGGGAVDKFLQNATEMVTTEDLCIFYGCDKHRSRTITQETLDQFVEDLKAALGAVGANELVLRSRRCVTPREVKLVQDVAAALDGRMGKLVRLIEANRRAPVVA